MQKTRHVLTGQIPPQQQPLGHGQQLCEVSSPSTYNLPEKSKGSDWFISCLTSLSKIFQLYNGNGPVK